MRSLPQSINGLCQLGKKRAGSDLVLTQLGNHRLNRRKVLVRAQSLEKLDGNFLPIEVAVEIEHVWFRSGGPRC